MKTFLYIAVYRRMQPRAWLETSPMLTMYHVGVPRHLGLPLAKKSITGGILVEKKLVEQFLVGNFWPIFLVGKQLVEKN